MKKGMLLLMVFATFVTITNAQEKIFTKTGVITFDATASLDKVYAVNKKSTCIVNTTTGAMEFAILIKAFEFEKALMEEHFNENYMESDQFPKSTFKGKIENLNEINFQKDGTYAATISGDLTIHGVTKHITINGSFTVAGQTVTAKSDFKVLLSDYDISIPSVVKETLSNEAKVTVNVILEQFTQ